MKDIKKLYETTINKIVKTPETKTEEKDGKKISTTIEIEKEVPVKLIIKQPTRREREDASLYYSIQLSELITKNVLTRHMLRKKILDQSGGILSNEESKEFIDILKKAQNLELEYQRLLLIPEKERKKEEIESLEKIQVEWSEIQQELQRLEQTQQSLFSNCAENLANNKLLVYYILYLSYLQEDKDIKPLFEGKTLDEKLDVYDKLDELNDKFYNEIISRCSLVVALWTNNLASEQSQFDEMLKKITAEPAKTQSKTEVKEQAKA